MKHILKAKKRFLCLLLAGALAACLSPAALAAPDGVEVAPGYDYTRFKDAGGRIVFDVKGEARSKMTVDDLLEKFRENAVVAGFHL